VNKTTLLAVDQSGLVFDVVYDGSLVALCVEDYESLCAAVTICATSG